MEDKEYSFASSLKSTDTEEWWDIKFNRPIGYMWARMAIPLHITPNMITIISIFIGAIGGWLFYYSSLKINMLGMLLLVLANTLDSADGQLARMTNNHTRLGRILDGMAGDIWFIIIYVALVLRLCNNDAFSDWGVWVLGIFAGISHILAASMADYYRNVHLWLLKGEAGSEHDHSKKILEDLHNTKFTEKPFGKVSLWFYYNYTKTQENLSPRLQSFFTHLQTIFSGTIPEYMRKEMISKNKKFMPYTNVLQFNTRVAFLFFTMFIDKVWLYFVFDLTVMNLILSYLIIREERLFYDYDKQLVNNA